MSNTRKFVGLSILLSALLCGCDVALFYEPFEDGDLTSPPPGWVESNPQAYWPSIADPAMDPGNHWLRLEAHYPECGDSSYTHYLGGIDEGITPDNISFDFLPHFHDKGDIATFSIAARPEGAAYCGSSPIIGFQAIDVRFTIEHDPWLGDVAVLSSNRADVGTFSVYVTHHVELKDIVWDATPQTFDLYVNGEFKATRPFVGQGDTAPDDLPVDDRIRAASFYAVSLYNYKGYNTEGESGWIKTYWDNIQMVENDNLNPLTHLPFRPIPQDRLLADDVPIHLDTCEAGFQPLPSLVPSETETSTPPPTSTWTPTATRTPTRTPTATQLPGIVVKAVKNLNCRRGTTTQFGTLHILMEGETANVTAVNPSHTWAYLEIPEMNLYCWAWRGGLEDSRGSADDAPVRDDPATPTPTFTPSATPIECRPDLSQEDCIASGGTWSESMPGAPACVCP